MLMQDHVMNCICDICLKLRAELSIEFGSSWEDKGKLHLISTVYCQSISVLEGGRLEKTQKADQLQALAVQRMLNLKVMLHFHLCALVFLHTGHRQK